MVNEKGQTMSDYRDFFIDGPRGPRRDPDAPNEFFTPGRTLANGRASLTVTMTKAEAHVSRTWRRAVAEKSSHGCAEGKDA